LDSMNKIKSLLGAREVLFFIGYFAFLYGVSGLWSMYGAFMTGGIVLMLMAFMSVYSVRGKSEQ